MNIGDFLAPEDVMLDVKAGDKTQTLRMLAKQAALATNIDEQEVTTAILKREELGSTGVGNGVALPHARLTGIAAPFGLLARLHRPIDFAAIDDRPVDLVFLLLLPEAADKEQLNALACVARALRNSETLRRMRSAVDRASLFRAVTELSTTA